MSKVVTGQLEIDSDRGVIYFHSNLTGATTLRICNLPTPIPEHMLDITHMIATNWIGNQKMNKAPSKITKGVA